MRALIVLMVLSLTGCAMHTVSGLICRPDFEIGQRCTVYDPILKQQVVIDPQGVTTTCDLDKIKKIYTCYYTYIDSIGNSWTTKAYDERVMPR